jgi:hypothetical protein
MTGHEALLYVSSIFLAAKNGYDNEGRWNLEA